jgi:hypothetical protein
MRALVIALVAGASASSRSKSSLPPCSIESSADLRLGWPGGVGAPRHRREAQGSPKTAVIVVRASDTPVPEAGAE